MEEVVHFYEQVVPAHLRVFLDVQGITMSEADHRANMVKEELTKISSELANTNGYTATADIKGKTVSLDNYQKVENLADKCQKEGKYYGLSAWLREGINAKTKALELAKSTPQIKFVLDNDEVITLDKKAPETEWPKIITPTEEDVLDEFTIKERAEYYIIEAEAAHLGKKLHESAGQPVRGNGILSQISNKEGKLKQMRDQLLNYQPNELREMKVGLSHEVVIIDNRTLYNKDEFESVYMQLQSKHRSLEARLNFYKARIKDRLAELTTIANEEYRVASRKAAQEESKLLGEYNLAKQEYTKKIADRDLAREARRLKLIRYISKLKIVIPEALEPLNQEIAALGNTEA